MANEIYFGRPGFLAELPQPRGGVKATRVRPTSVFATAGGRARVDRMLDGSREYVLSWNRLFYEDWAYLEGFDQGLQGPGPFALLDPGRINLLQANQAGATSVSNSASGFTPATSAQTVTSDQFLYNRGPRSLDWNFTTTTSASLALDPPSDSWPGIPVINRSMAFSFLARRKPATASAQVRAVMQWLDVSGNTLETTLGTYTVVTSGAWVAVSLIDSPPSSAAAYLNVSVHGSGQASGTYFALDNFQLEVGASATTWRPATGVMPVQVVSLDEQWPWQASTFRENATMVLQEVDE